MLLEVLQFIKEYSYIGIFLIVFLESGIFFALPGDSLLFGVGIMAAKGYLSLPSAILSITVATILGGYAGYFIGEYFEKYSSNRFLKKIIKKDKIDQANAFFKKHGNKTIFLARFVPVVRTFAPMVAGFTKMSFARFSKYNILGGVLWGALLPTLSYFLGERFPWIGDNITLIFGAVIFITAFPFFFEIAKHRLTRAK